MTAGETAMRAVFCSWLLLVTAYAVAAPQGSDLKLLISVDQATIAEPFPARVTLHLHNSGTRTLWIDTPVRDVSVVSGTANPFLNEEPGPGATSGGSALEVHLAPMGAFSPVQAAEGRALEVAGFPNSKLMAIGSGQDYEEKTELHLSPAYGGQNDSQPLWGNYKLSVTFSASFSNGENLNRILATDIWQGQIESNSIQVNLQPPAADTAGSVSGSVLDAHSQPVFGAIVTLSDRQEQVLAQTLPDNNGKFSFSHLPFGFYWVTARSRGSDEDTTVYRHVELSGGEPAGSVQLVMLRPEVYHPQQLRHKPVLIRIFDPNDMPLGDVSLDSTWSSGTVLNNVKARTGDDGAATLELIPGRNYLSLRRKGCPKQDERIDVAPGGGIDGFKLVFNCAKR